MPRMPVRLALACLLLAFAGCGVATAGLPRAVVELGGERFMVEVASDDRSRMRGLMFRDELPRDHGMLFVFEQELPLAFWMKNTRIPLDILYFDGQRRLVSVSANAPPCTTPYCPQYPSTGPARYVLELNAGLADELGLATGAVLRILPAGDQQPTLD
jgi:uncharacterized protein